jgi:hypothetical protein
MHSIQFQGVCPSVVSLEPEKRTLSSNIQFQRCGLSLNLRDHTGNRGLSPASLRPAVSR